MILAGASTVGEYHCPATELHGRIVSQTEPFSLPSTFQNEPNGFLQLSSCPSCLHV